MIVPLAFEPHHGDHLDPVVKLLGPVGKTYTSGDDIALVSSYGALIRARRMKFRRFVLAQHGAGQSYAGERRTLHQPGYPGGKDNGDVGMFLVPNEQAAKRWRDAYPKTRVAVVGCPKLDDLPARVRSIGVQCDPWQDFAAAIQTQPRMFASGLTGGVVCAAHAIADKSPHEPKSKGSRGTDRSPNTIDSGTLPDDQKLPPVPTDLVSTLTAAVTSGMSECTSSSATSCRGRATSAIQPIDWKSRSAGIRLRKHGNSTPEGSHTLLIPTTTFGFVSLVIPCMTARADTGGRVEQPVVCTSFHWAAHFSPEAGSAFMHFWEGVLKLRKAGYHVIGHGHPLRTDLPAWYRKHGIEYVPTFAEVCQRADLYVCDNSSTIFEFASTGRPVVLLNSPQYRKRIHHGLRFWDAATVGVQCESSIALPECVDRALADEPAQQAKREAALDLVYPIRTGGAQRAADAILDWSGLARAAA